MNASVSLPNQWNAREYQKGLFNAILVEGKKRACVVFHRRAGKDSMSINLLAVLSQLKVGTYWHALPSFQQGRRVIWDGIDKLGRKIVDQAFPPEIVESKNETQMQVKLKNGSIYQVVGSDNMDALVGTNPIGVVFSEYAIGSPVPWDYVRPILAENGGVAIFIYTPRGRNHGWNLYRMAKSNPSWYCEKLGVEETGALPLEAVEEERLAGMPEELIQQEYYCSFEAAISGSYYGDLIRKLWENKAISDFNYDTDDVSTSWDLGISDSTAIWFWREGRDGVPEIIDCYSAHGLPISHYVEVIKARGYNYIRHWLPHDAQARTLATGMSIMEQLRDQGIPVAISPRLSLEDGIQAVRAVLQQPIRIHETNCKKGLEALEAYHREYDEVTKTFKAKPCHDWSSHLSDGFRYMSLSIKAAMRMSRSFIAMRAEAATPKPLIVLPTMDDLWAMRESDNKRSRARIS
jgi:phage terminase large subunit